MRRITENLRLKGEISLTGQYVNRLYTGYSF